MKTAIAIPLFALAAVALAETPPVAVNFKVAPEATLPGVPVDFHFEFVNRSAGKVTVPNRLLIIVRNSTGQTFAPLSRGDNSYPAIALEELKEISLVPRGTEVRDIQTEGDLRRVPWTTSRRLAKPGIYQLQAFFPLHVAHEGATFDEIRQDSIASNVVTLTVEDPHGRDADAWREMQAACNGDWSTGYLFGKPELVSRIATTYADTTYGGWFAASGVSKRLDENVDLLRNWLAHAPADAYTHWRQLNLARWQVMLADKYHRSDAVRSSKYEKEARELLNSILRQTKDPNIKAAAQDRLDYLDEPEEP